MKPLRVLSCLATLGVIFAVGSPDLARACGGGYGGVPLRDPIRPAASHVESWLYNDWYWGENGPESVSRFLHVARALDADGVDELTTALETGVVEVEDPPVGPRSMLPVMLAALGEGDLRRAEDAAREIVEGVADLPVPLAEPHLDALRLAVELIEVRPLLKKVPPAAAVAYFSSIDGPAPRTLALAAAVRSTAPSPDLVVPNKHPRAGSLAWLKLRGELATLPDGWSAEDMRAAAPGAAQALQAKVDAWLARYPNHPLRPWAQLKKVRLHYLEGESDAAWAILFRMYNDHPGRVTNEMRFLVRQGAVPSSVAWADLPVEIAAGLLTEVAYDEADWNMLWQKTETEPTAAWSVALQERLLLTAMRDLAAAKPLPREFPKAAGAPTVAWGRLRVAALVDASQAPEAEAQMLAMPGEDQFLAPLRARLAIERGDWIAAIRTPQIAPEVQWYLIRVIAPDDAVAALIDDKDEVVKWEARLSLATRRLAATGDWYQGASLLDSVDPDRAALWREAALLDRNRSPSGRLQFARFMKRSAGKIFLQAGGHEMDWYRALPVTGPHEAQLPTEFAVRNWPTPEQEWKLTEAFLKRNYASWMAFEAYAAWLTALDPRSVYRPAVATQARQVLAEADEVYNNLVNYGSWDFFAWGNIAVDSQAAKDVRLAGRGIRAAP